jgi:hypothetical protein
MKPLRLFSGLLLALALPAPGRELKPQGPADVIKLRGPSGVVLPVTEISDAGQIAALTAFINDLPGKWDVPWYGPPVGQVYLTFHRNGKFVGNFYVGPWFFGRDGGNFWSQRARRPQVEQLGALLGFDLVPCLEAATRRKPPPGKPR